MCQKESWFHFQNDSLEADHEQSIINLIYGIEIWVRVSQISSYNTVRTPIVDPFPIEDPSLKIQIEDPFSFSKKWVLGVLY